MYSTPSSSSARISSVDVTRSTLNDNDIFGLFDRAGDCHVDVFDSGLAQLVVGRLDAVVTDFDHAFVRRDADIRRLVNASARVYFELCDHWMSDDIEQHWRRSARALA